MKTLFTILSLFTFLLCSSDLSAQSTPPICLQNWNPSPCSSCIFSDSNTETTVWTYCGNSTTNSECLIYAYNSTGGSVTLPLYYAQLIDASTGVVLDGVSTQLNEYYRLTALNPDGSNFSGMLRIRLYYGQIGLGAVATTERFPFNCL
ncbi:hypothetical protein N9B82_05140 [Saprospiraceae bacterium]|nr:hypothetical protein [Saprospiraceae bacterium]